MARPKKDRTEIRRRWSVINATSREREAVEDFARAVGLGTSEYILRRALQAPVAPRQDWQRIVRQQAQILRQLDEIAIAVRGAQPIRDVGSVLLALRRIEADLSGWEQSTETEILNVDQAEEDQDREGADGKVASNGC
jgi:hypothetical protein